MIEAQPFIELQAFLRYRQAGRRGLEHRMKRAFPTLVVSAAAAIALVGGSTLAQSKEAIHSDEKGALPAPNEWECEIILPEYQAYLDEGNPASEWQFVGKTYYDGKARQYYDWGDWLEWVKTSGCDVGPLVTDQFLALPFAGQGVVGGLISFFGGGLVAASTGSEAISPG